MSAFSHTFHYDDEADFARQLDLMSQKLIEKKLEPYDVVRERYGFADSAPAFCMRLKRFLRKGGQFPHVTGAKGKKILKLAVTPLLHQALSK